MSAVEVPPQPARHQSYRRILSATSVLGGAAAVNVLIGMVRSKIVAVFLGKDGLGQMGMYMSISGLAVNIASFGLSISGVRELADAAGSGDIARIQSSRLTLRRLSWWLGIAGCLISLLAAYPIAQSTFGTTDQASQVAWLSTIILLTLLGNYWMVVVQVSGQMSRVGKVQVVSAILGAVTSIACFIVFRKQGIVPALILGSAIPMAVAAYWSRGSGVPAPDSSTHFSRDAAKRLLSLGGADLAVGIQASLVALLLRKFILDSGGLDAVGIFQAAQALSAMYATYILNAMSTDFLPRLTVALHDQRRANSTFNDQTVIALLLGLPGVVATIVFAPWMIRLFYSARFADTVPVLQVMAVGIFGRLLTWPLGMALIAAGAKTERVAGEFIASAVQLGVTWTLLPSIGVIATGIAINAVNVVQALLYYYWVRRSVQFRWSAEVYSALLLGAVTLGSALAIVYLLPQIPATLVGSVLLTCSAAYCLRRIAATAGVSRTGLVNRLLSLRESIVKKIRR